MRKYYLVLLCCLRDRHQLQTSVKDNKQYPFFYKRLTDGFRYHNFRTGVNNDFKHVSV